MVRSVMLSLAVALAAFVSSVSAVEVGEKAPDFKAQGVDGKEYSLDGAKDAKAVVVCFTCNRCPVAVDYEDRFIEFTKKYADKGVKFIAINVNDNDAETLQAMKDRVEEKGFNFPYTRDESGESAKKYGARVTPHIYLLDKDRKVAYIGAFDDNPDASKAEKTYLTNAVDALLAGKEIETKETRAVGCGIQIKK